MKALRFLAFVLSAMLWAACGDATGPDGGPDGRAATEQAKDSATPGEGA